MSILRLPGSAPLLVEIDQEKLVALSAGSIMQFQLERAPDGRLLPACKARLIEQWRVFTGTALMGTRVVCAISGRGLTLRRLTVPSANSEEQTRLLALQVEAEFPLPPDKLAWGWVKLREGTAGAPDEILLGAMRPELLQDYTEIFNRTAQRVMFTPAALVRASTLPRQSHCAAQLHLEESHSELLTLEAGLPASLRCFAWGTTNLAAAVGSPGTNGTLERLAASLANATGNGSTGRSLCITGTYKGQEESVATLARAGGLVVEYPQVGGDARASGAALRTLLERKTPTLWLSPEKPAESKKTKWVAVLRQKGAAVAAALLISVLLFPYLEAVVAKPFLARKLARIKEDRGRLTAIDRELDFLRYLKDNQAPYIDAFYLLSRAAPQGTRFDSLVLNRRGEMSLRVSMRDANQVADFRSKLLDYGVFANLAVEEQSPSPDRQKLSLRMSAQWQPAKARAAASKLAANSPAKPARPDFAPPSMGMGPGIAGEPPVMMPIPLGMPSVTNTASVSNMAVGSTNSAVASLSNTASPSLISPGAPVIGAGATNNPPPAGVFPSSGH